MTEKFDVIVVGGGLAGLTTAYELAKADIQVLLIERGTYSGAKNITGGRIYTAPLQFLLNEWKDIPFERRVSHEKLTFISNQSALTIELASEKFNVQPQSYTLLRAKFDRWLAEKVEEAGATLVTKMTVDRILRKKGCVTGISSGGDEVNASVVVLAEGSNSILTEQLGLRPSPDPTHLAVGVKELITLPCNKINERFNVSDGEGVAQLFVGAVTEGLRGGGFLYTNRDSISLGVVIGIDAAVRNNINVHELTEKFKTHPAIQPLIRDGKVAEYSAHIIPEAGMQGIAKLYDNGILVVGDAAGLCLNMGLAVKGMDYAILSGHFAAQAARGAIENQDYSASTLSKYETLLKNSIVLKDFETFKHAPRFLERRQLYSKYPDIVCELFETLLRFGSCPKSRFVSTSTKLFVSKISVFELIKDLWYAWRL